MISSVPCIITVPYSILQGFPKYQFSRFSSSIICEYQCVWTDRLTFAKELLGRSEISDSTLIFYQPHQFPLIPRCFAREIQNIEGMGWLGTVDYQDDVPIPNYEHAILTVNYSTPEWDQPSETNEALVSESFQSATEFITLEHLKFYWDSSHAEPLEAGESPSKLIKMVEWNVTIHRMTTLPPNFGNIIGKINQYQVYSPRYGITFAPETLLCGDVSIRKETSLWGIDTGSVTFKYLYRPNTWNKFPHVRQTTGEFAFDPVRNYDGEPVPIYELESFAGFIP